MIREETTAVGVQILYIEYSLESADSDEWSLTV